MSNYTNHWDMVDFNEEYHTYKVHGVKFPSVSKQLKAFAKPFDRSISKFVAKSRSKKEGRPVSPQEILREWDAKREASAQLGSDVHNYLEDYVQRVFIDASAEGIFEDENGELVCQLDNYFVTDRHQKLEGLRFWSHLIKDYKQYVPVALEQILCSEAYKFAGTADVILFNTETQKYVIVDYKTNEDLYKNYKKQKLLKPFDDLLDTPFNKYALQLSHYQLMMEEYGYEVEDRIIVWLPHEEDKPYQKLHTPDLTEKLKEYYESKNNTGTRIYFT